MRSVIMLSMSAPLVLIKIFFLVMFLATNVLLARTLSVGDYGVFVFCLSFITVSSIINSLGLEKYIAREIQIFRSSGKNASLIKLQYDAIFLLSLFSFFTVTLLYLFLFPSSYLDIVPDNIVVQLCLIIVIESFLRVYRGITVGMGVPVHSEACSLFLRPAAFMLLILLVVSVVPEKLGITTVINCYLVASIISISPIPFLGDIGRSVHESLSSRLARTPVLATGAVVFLLTELVFGLYANVDIFMVGMMLDKTEAGIYGIANRGAYVIAFTSSSFALVMMTKVSSYHAQKDHQKLQAIFSRACYLMLVLSGLIFTGYLLLANPVLEFLGAEYLAAKTPFLILSLSQVISAAFGPVGLVLIMTGNQWKVIKCMVLAISLNVLLNLVLIPVYGLIAAAINSLLAMILWNSILLVIVIRELGLRPGLFNPAQKNVIQAD